MNQLPILLKREFWEHRVVFLYLPAVISTLMIGILILMGVGLRFDLAEVSVSESNSDGSAEEHYRLEVGPNSSEDINSQQTTLAPLVSRQLRIMSNAPFSYKERTLDELYASVSAVLLFVLFFVIVFYLIGSLYEDRKDRSTLFWKSLPVSDGMTVLSKLLTAIVLAPVIFFVFIVLSHIALLLVSTVLALGEPIDLWDTLWAPANLISRWLYTAGFLLFWVLWCSPFTGWVLFISAWAKSVPLGWVVGIPLLLGILESVFTNSTAVSDFMTTHLFVEDFRAMISSHLPTVWNTRALSDVLLEVLVAVVFGMVFVGLAIRQRGHADEL